MPNDNQFGKPMRGNVIAGYATYWGRRLRDAGIVQHSATVARIVAHLFDDLESHGCAVVQTVDPRTVSKRQANSDVVHRAILGPNYTRITNEEMASPEMQQRLGIEPDPASAPVSERLRAMFANPDHEATEAEILDLIGDVRNLEELLNDGRAVTVSNSPDAPATSVTLGGMTCSNTLRWPKETP